MEEQLARQGKVPSLTARTELRIASSTRGLSSSYLGVVSGVLLILFLTPCSTLTSYLGVVSGVLLIFSWG